MSSTTSLLWLLEQYFDAVPRSDARAEDHGSLTLFVRDSAGYPYYARPRLGQGDQVTVRDVLAVCARQRELGIPERFEYVPEAAPAMVRAAASAGLYVTEHPLLVLDSPGEAVPPPAGVTVRMLSDDAADVDVARAQAVARLGFSTPGTATGATGPDAVTSAAEDVPLAQIEATRQRLRNGLTATAVALSDGVPVGVGSHQPVGAVSEIVAVATLPAARRRGIASAVTRTLTEDALARGCATVFLSAGDDEVARVYQRAGFRRVATACIGHAR